MAASERPHGIEPGGKRVRGEMSERGGSRQPGIDDDRDSCESHDVFVFELRTLGVLQWVSRGGVIMREE